MVGKDYLWRKFCSQIPFSDKLIDESPSVLGHTAEKCYPESVYVDKKVVMVTGSRYGITIIIQVFRFMLKDHYNLKFCYKFNKINTLQIFF